MSPRANRALYQLPGRFAHLPDLHLHLSSWRKVKCETSLSLSFIAPLPRLLVLPFPSTSNADHGYQWHRAHRGLSTFPYWYPRGEEGEMQLQESSAGKLADSFFATRPLPTNLFML